MNGHFKMNGYIPKQTNVREVTIYTIKNKYIEYEKLYVGFTKNLI
jgi:hypothetical protein